MTTFDYATEHAEGHHAEFAPAGCQQCRDEFKGHTGIETPAPRSRPSSGVVGNLGEALKTLRRGFVVDQPEEPDPGPEAPDGNPWCEACRGARVVAVRQGRTPTTYVRCPDCLHAAWAIQQRVDRLLGSLPPRFAEWRLATFPTTTAHQRRTLELARSWLEDASPSWLFLWGPTGCVAPETLIQGPDGAERIDEFAARGLPIRVWALGPDGPTAAWASAPFRKGRAPLYRVRLASGREIVATGQHRFLTPGGWRVLDQLGVGSRLGFGPLPRESIVAVGRPKSLPGDLGWIQTRGGWTADCFDDPRQCDRRPRPAPGGDATHPPSRVGAHEHSRGCCSRDDRAPAPGHTRPYPSFAPRARSDSPLLIAHEIGVEHRAGRALYGRLCESSHTAPPTLRVTILHRAGAQPRPPQSWREMRSDRTNWSSAKPPCEFDTVTDCTPCGDGDYFDLQVPGYENYLANGVWNHNSGKTGLAVGILHELALRGNSTALRNVPDLLTTIKSTFSQEGDESESSILDVLAAVDVLCLDDLGAEYHRGREDWAAEKVFQIVAARHAALKRTIVTSNYSLEQLQDRLGHPRTLRRIVDMTGSRWIVDFRRMPQIGAL